MIDGLGTGGAERSAADLAGPLRERGVETTYAYFHARGTGVEQEIATNFETTHIGPRFLAGLRGLRKVIDKTRPDVIHTTLFEADIAGRLASIGTGIPVLTSIVNTSYSIDALSHPDVSAMKLALARELDGLTARRLNNSFHTLTNVAADYAQTALRIPINKISVVPRGRSLARLGTPSRARRDHVRKVMGLGQTQSVLLNVGRQEHQKGQIHAIDAMAIIAHEISNPVLIIAGRAGTASERLIERINTHGLQDNVRMIGHSSEVPDLMAASDALVFPSLYEGFGGTLIEAMALDLPIIASNIPVHKEVVSDAALLVDPASSGSIANAMMNLINNPDLADSLRQAGRQTFLERFTIDTVADQTADLYKSI